MLCCPCWGTSHFSTFASDHESSNTFIFRLPSPSSVFSVLYCVFLFLVINRSVAGVVCPVAGARPVAGEHYHMAWVILTVERKITP